VEFRYIAEVLGAFQIRSEGWRSSKAASFVFVLLLAFVAAAEAQRIEAPVPPGSATPGASPANPPGSEPTGTGEAAPTKAGAAETRSSVGDVPDSRWGDDSQVRVVGGEPYTRVKFSVYVNEFREDFRWLLFRLRPEFPGARTAWSIPVEIELWGSMGDVHRGEDLLTRIRVGPDNRFLIRLVVKLHDSFREEEFRLELLRALLIEQILAPYAGDPGTFPLEKVEPPPWLLQGFDQLIEHRRLGNPSAFYRGFLASGQMLKPAEIFAVEETDSYDPVRLAIFRASASAMVESLLDQPDGDEGLRGLLGDLGRPEPVPTEVLLRQHFPAFRELEGGLDKWWALEVAALGQQQGFEFLDREETERLLTEALTVRFEGGSGSPADVRGPDEFASDAVLEATGSGESPAPPKRGFFDFLKPKKKEPAPEKPVETFVGTVDQFALFLDRRGAKEQLAAAFDRIQVLKRVGFPLYRPVFSAYEVAIARLIKGEVKDLPAEFEAAAKMRSKVGETIERTEDYLNFFEATRAPRRSSAFDDYLRLRKALDEKPRPRRNDRISRYLDSVEWEFR